MNAVLTQDMDPIKRGNMVRRLPMKFREKLYFQYQAKYRIPRAQFNAMMESSNDEDPSRVRRKQGGEFEQRIAGEGTAALNQEVSGVLTNIIKWPSYVQSAKSGLTSGVGRSWRYVREKMQKNREGRRMEREVQVEEAGKAKAKKQSG